MSGWSKRPVAVRDGDALRLSLVFTWDLPWALMECHAGRMLGYPVVCGGPAVRLQPNVLPAENVDLSDDGDWLSLHNPDATRTSQGCPRSCSFCAVPRLHDLKEFPDFRPAPIVCDDNFLAFPRSHIERSVARLQDVKGVDFNQGLDARIFRQWHLDLLQTLDMAVYRFAWDSEGQEESVRRAVQLCLDGGVNCRKIRVYVLLNHGESPENARYRCEVLKDMGVWVNPQRYQPLDRLSKNSYTAPEWEEQELRRFVKYWSRMAWLRQIPYEGFIA